jgi:RND family efflux transporter MFP subunit
LEKDLPKFPEINDDKLKIFLASRNILSEYYNIKKGELELSRRTYVAPFDGTYTQVNLEVGSYTNMGGRVANAIRTDVLEQEVPLDKFDADWVKVGDKVVLKSDEYNTEWQGRVVRKNNFIDENTQTQGVFIRVNNNKSKPLYAGDYLTTYFPGQPVDNSMEVPRNSVFNGNEVFIIENGRLRKKEVNVIKVNITTLLIGGLPIGDTLVVQPLINVLEGTEVAVHGDEFKDNSEKKKKMMGQNKAGNQ